MSLARMSRLGRMPLAISFLDARPDSGRSFIRPVSSMVTDAAAGALRVESRDAPFCGMWGVNRHAKDEPSARIRRRGHRRRPGPEPAVHRRRAHQRIRVGQPTGGRRRSLEAGRRHDGRVALHRHLAPARGPPAGDLGAGHSAAGVRVGIGPIVAPAQSCSDAGRSSRRGQREHPPGLHERGTVPTAKQQASSGQRIARWSRPVWPAGLKQIGILAGCSGRTHTRWPRGASLRVRAPMFSICREVPPRNSQYRSGSCQRGSSCSALWALLRGDEPGQTGGTGPEPGRNRSLVVRPLAL